MERVCVPRGRSTRNACTDEPPVTGRRGLTKAGVTLSSGKVGSILSWASTGGSPVKRWGENRTEEADQGEEPGRGRDEQGPGIPALKSLYPTCAGPVGR